MRDPYAPSPSVVVGIDGSRSAGQAAQWAIDEVVDRDVPLQLVYAIDATEGDHDDATGEVAAAEHAINDVISAIESTRKPV
ncbi:MAG: universal stress protein, partial [Mycobacterium sp.]|nr:universal stress protein [Mycobacterium sp.]